MIEFYTALKEIGYIAFILELMVLFVYSIWLLLRKLGFRSHIRIMIMLNLVVYIVIVIVLYWFGGLQ